MEKEFIPYEQALDLKELGFDEPCFAIYNLGLSEFETANIGQIRLFSSIFKIDDKQSNISYVNDKNSSKVSAPLYQQAFRWFREKCSIQATIEPTKDQHRFELGFNYWIWNTKTAEEWFTEPRDRPAGDYVFDTYEEAELECLKKLIQITNEKI